ncbi:MAG: TlpA family protein disulfide reductase [Tannerellaceae bacterium]|jgi:peroxiredoxin|nr:TlpA family protein disulfide reductase [Tannerellaceae bacterium]
MKTTFYLIGMLLFSIFASTAQDRKESIDDTRGYLTKVGDMAPDFEVEYTDGTHRKLSSFRGKVVMLQFTASWCGVCIREMPFIESDIWQKYKEREDFELFGLALKEGADKIQTLVSKTKITYPILSDPTGSIFYTYAEAGAGVTRNVIIDRTGKIIFQTRLYNPEEFEEMKKAISAELHNTHSAKALSGNKR